MSVSLGLHGRCRLNSLAVIGHGASLPALMKADQKIKVRLTRKRDGRSWNFSSASSDGRFFVNNEGFGRKGCIIFRPGGIDSFKAGDEYTVSIDGLASGEDIEYTVRFFSLGIDNPNRDENGYRAVTSESTGCDMGASILNLAALAIMRSRDRK